MSQQVPYWRGVPLETHQVVVNLVSSTRTEEGLEVHCWLDGKTYQTAKYRTKACKRGLGKGFMQIVSSQYET
ncbi:ISAzo13-like element transposase-related protein, partial [Phormidesmis priestleyi]|uniref:ISAzo13-like element transposase-related protein n=1 Tax=Phormidesmis priestleyi TaxID=268141 RepID=UPI003CC82870